MSTSSALADGNPVLRIAMVTETYPPEINGVAMTIARIVDALMERQHAVQLIRPRQDGAPESDPSSGPDQILVGSLPIPGYSGLRMGLPARRRLLRLWSEWRPDIVHVATEGPLGWSALAAAKALAIPRVAGFHTNFHSYSQHYGIGWLQRAIHGYLRGFHNRADLTLVPTARLRQELSAARYRNVEVMARGADTRLFSPDKRSDRLRQAWGVGAEGLAVTYVGRIAPEKNLTLLAEAFAAIQRVRPDARLILVGDGPALAGLRSAHPRYVFAGPRRGEDLAAHFASADLFLFPSQTETFGNVLIEAMASGLAVVAFDYAAAAEHVRHGENGLKASMGDALAFVDLAKRIAADSAQRKDLGQAARATALGLSWDAIFHCLEDHYRRLLDGERAPDEVVPAGCSPASP